MMEYCILCNDVADSHPYVGIGRTDLRATTGRMTAYPVCARCCQDPTHRVGPPAKLHFMPRASRDLAVHLANALLDRSEAGGPLDLGRGA